MSAETNGKCFLLLKIDMLYHMRLVKIIIFRENIYNIRKTRKKIKKKNMKATVLENECGTLQFEHAHIIFT